MQANGEFELSVLTGEVSPAPDMAPPRSQTVQLLSNLEEVRGAVNTVAGNAQRLMSLFSPDLEPAVYDQTQFLDILKRFLLAKSFAKVRVLIGDPGKLARDSNRFVAMARRLSSYIDIRVLRDAAPNPFPSYLIADDRALVYRANATTFDGVCDLDNQAVARVHLARFDEAWNACAPDFGSRAAMR